MIGCGLKIIENCHVLVNQFQGNLHSKTLGCREKYMFSGMSNDALMHREGLKG